MIFSPKKQHCHLKSITELRWEQVDEEPDAFSGSDFDENWEDGGNLMMIQPF